MRIRTNAALKCCLNLVTLFVVLFQPLSSVLAEQTANFEIATETLIAPEPVASQIGTNSAVSTPAARVARYAPGTIVKDALLSDTDYSIYLPYILLGDVNAEEEIALSPDIWIKQTADWQSLDKDTLGLRYPAVMSLQDQHLDNEEGYAMTGAGQTIQVVFHDRNAENQSPPIKNTLVRENEARQVTFKGMPAWLVIPGNGTSGFCREVVIEGPDSWVSFTLHADSADQCFELDTFNLITSSLQFQVGDSSFVPEERDSSPNQMMAMVTYDRNASYNYAATYGTQSTNNDGYYISGADGGHYLAHFLQAGGFPIHWNVGQNNSNSAVINMAAQRTYVLNSGYAWVTSAASASVGDVIYMKLNGNWCWGSGVVRMSGGVPYASGHSANYFNVRYDAYRCGTGTTYEIVHIDARTDHPANPQINSGVDLSPATQITGNNVATSFNVYNYGGQPVNMSLRVTTNGGGDFATTSCYLPSEGNCSYYQTRSFSTSANYTICAQMDTGGGWVNIPVASGVGCRTLSIVPPSTTDVRLTGSLVLTPNVLQSPGGAVQAAFTVNNAGSYSPTERFRARVVSGATSFAETGNVSLSPGGNYAYNQSASFTTPGIYEVVAEHLVNGTWYSLLAPNGSGSGFVRVMAPPPPPQEEAKGTPKGGGYAGDPVNTATGNYVSDFTDLSTPLPGFPLDVTRWYNSLDAAQVNGPFGYGTSWLYGTAVTWRADKTATVRMADGHTAYYVGTVNPANPGDLSGTYTSQGDDVAVLVRALDGTSTLTYVDETVYSFDAAGRLMQIRKPDPALVTIAYSGGLPVRLTHSGGVIYNISYEGARIKTITSSTGRSVSYSYSPAGDLLGVTMPDGSTYTYTYDVNHRMAEARDPNNHAFIRNIFDLQGRVIEQYDQVGAKSTFTYNDAARTQTFVNPLGHTLTHLYDTNGRLIRETDSLGHSNIYTYDALGNMLTRTDKSGSTWTFTYDSRGNKLTEKDPLGSSWTYTYDSRSNRTSQVDPFGKTWTYTFDDNSRLTEIIDPLGYKNRYGFDPQGNTIWEENQNGARTTYENNSLGLPTRITDPMGNQTLITYDSFGNRTTYTDAAGRAVHFTYDALNRMSSSTDPLGRVINYTYDALGNLLSETDGMGHTRAYTYDAFDNLISETDFAGNTTTYTYDAAGQLTTATDAAGNSITYTYDAVGNRATETDKDGGVTRYEYDPAGRLVKEIDPFGNVTTYIYNAAGLQAEIQRPCTFCAGGKAVVTTSYDGAGRMTRLTDARGAVTSFTYDSLGRLAVETNPANHTTTYSYDPAGSCIQETDVLGRVTSFTYDLNGHLITRMDGLGFVTTNAYDAVGNLVSVTNARGFTTTNTYDENDRLIQVADALGNETTNTYDAVGNLLTTTGPSGSKTTYTYDANGNPLTITNARGFTTNMEYDALNRPKRVTDALGSVSTIEYDALGRITAETNALGGVTRYTYDLLGYKLTQTTPLGYTTTHAYDSTGNLITRIDPDGARWQFAYDANGNQVGTTDPLGRDFVTEYDQLNRPVRYIDPLGGVVRMQYDAAGQLTATIDQRGALTRNEYDALGRITKTIGPLGETFLYTYDEVGNQLTATDPRGGLTQISYDALNRPILQEDALGGTFSTSYDTAGRVAAVADANGATTQYRYDAVGNRVEIISPAGGVVKATYDALNQPITRTDALNRTWTYAFDAIGQAISETTPSGHSTTSVYDADGNVLIETDAQGNKWHTSYDASGRAVQKTDPLGREVRNTYDLLGQPIVFTDELGRETNYTYDALGRLTVIEGPDGSTQQYTYDLVDNVLTEQDGNGNPTRYEYDLNNRVIRKTNGVNKVWRYKYDAGGNQTMVASPDSRILQLTYDLLGRVTSKAYDGIEQASYTYDAIGNHTGMTDAAGVTTYAYDLMNQLISSVDPAGRTVLYSYDGAGQQTRLTYPDGSIAKYEYDQDGLLSRLIGPDGGITTYQYNALGQVTLTSQANGVAVHYDYDPTGSLTAMTQKSAGGEVFYKQEYTLDAAGRRTTLVAQSPQATITTDYSYDDLDRLTASISSDGIQTSYTFDSAGNRVTQSGTRKQNGSLESYTRLFVYNAANQTIAVSDSLTGQTTYTYDDSGNRTGMTAPQMKFNYAYDIEGHLTEARKQTRSGSSWIPAANYEQYRYDGHGRRAQETSLLTSDDTEIHSSTTLYDNATEWNVLQTYETGVTPVDTKYLYDSFLHKAAFFSGDQTGFLQSDSLGSVIGVTDESGGLKTTDVQSYGDYGEAEDLSETMPGDDGFTGYEWDDFTSLYYARNRYYDPDTGSFLTVDPYPANRKDTLDLHRYAYVQSDPVNRTDPLGLFQWTGSASGIIERGDTLWGIAADYWGVSRQNVNWNMIQAILDVNPSISNASVIYAGSSLRLPSPLSAYSYLANSQQSASARGTSGSECGKHNSTGGNGGSTSKGGSTNRGGGSDSGLPGGGGGGGGSGWGSSPITITDNTRTSPFWDMYFAFTKTVLKAKFLKSTIETPKISVPLPPIPPIGFAGGMLRWQFKFESSMSVLWNSEKYDPVCSTSGWCAEYSATAKLEAEIPLIGPIKFGAWGKITGKFGVCREVVWTSQTNLYIDLKPYGKVSGEIGAKIFVGTGDFYVLGLKAKMEAGVEGVLNAESQTRGIDIWFEAGPYLEASAKGWCFDFKTEWREIRYKSRRANLSFGQLSTGGAGGW